MAKKDEQLKKNETNAVSDDKPLEKKAVEELQEEFSSIFNEDYDDTEEDIVWDEPNGGFPLLPFRRKSRYGNYYGMVDEDEAPKAKKEKKPVFPWTKKAEKDASKDTVEKEDTKVESSDENAEETTPVIKDEEFVVAEPVDEAPAVEESKEEQEEKPQENPVFEENDEEEPVKEEKTEASAKKKFGLPVMPWTLKKNKGVQEKTVTEETEEKTEESEAVEEIVEEEVIEELLSFEEQEKEEITEENEAPEIVEEIKEEDFDEKSSIVEEEAIEILPPFEETKAEEAFVELPPSEEDEKEEGFEELPPFEETITEEPAEEVSQVHEEAVELLPPFQVGEVPVTIPVAFEEKQAELTPDKKEKEKKAKKEKTQQVDNEPLTKKDHITFILALVALVMAVTFVFLKFFPVNNNAETPDDIVVEGLKLSEIQVVRQSVGDKYIQSDAENVYYSVSSENEVKYFEYKNGAMKPLQATGTVNAQVTMGKEILPVTINYVKADDGVFGISIFRSQDNPGSTLHNVITFKLVDLPKQHKAEGKALLLAVANSESASRRYNLWTDSFFVDLNSGTTTRFLTADKNTDSYSVAYSVLTNSACATDGDMVPFFTTREYTDGSGKKDLFVKNGEKESLFATDVYGEYIYADKNVVAYLKATGTGFNIVKKENTKEEKIVFSLYGNFSTDYLYHKEYILNKNDGNLYNAKTGEEIALAGYKMSGAEMMSISPDGRYLVVLGTVNSVADYQVHIFDLKKNDYAKYEELNFSQHYNLSFVDETKAMYVVVDPNGGYEQVVFDVSKAF